MVNSRPKQSGDVMGNSRPKQSGDVMVNSLPKQSGDVMGSSRSVQSGGFTVNITVLVSGGGTNLQAVIDGVEQGSIPGARIVSVISSNSKAFALRRAEKHGIPTRVVGGEMEPDQRNRALLQALKDVGTDLVILAGFMTVLAPEVVSAYERRIINIHPSLIPKYCGRGFYGKRVHQAVLDAGEQETGATVHYVDQGVDTGEVILQRAVPVLTGDTADSLAARVLETEHEILVEGINLVVKRLHEENGVSLGETEKKEAASGRFIRRNIKK